VLEVRGRRIWRTGFHAAVPPPTIPALRQLDASPGREIAVVVSRGASSASAGIFTIRNGKLRRMWIEGRAPSHEFLLLYASGGWGGAACVRGRVGEVVETFVEPITKGLRTVAYRVRKTAFRADGVGFRLVGSTARTVARRPDGRGQTQLAGCRG
jgi:hypothetical protein